MPDSSKTFVRNKWLDQISWNCKTLKFKLKQNSEEKNIQPPPITTGCERGHKKFPRRLLETSMLWKGRTGSSNQPWLTRQTSPISRSARWPDNPTGSLDKTLNLHFGISRPTVLLIWPTSLFDVAAHQAGEPTGPPGKCQAAQSADAGKLSLPSLWQFALCGARDWQKI